MSMKDRVKKESLLTKDQITSLRSMSRYWEEVSRRENQDVLSQEVMQVVRTLWESLLWIVSDFVNSSSMKSIELVSDNDWHNYMIDTEHKEWFYHQLDMWESYEYEKFEELFGRYRTWWSPEAWMQLYVVEEQFNKKFEKIETIQD